MKNEFGNTVYETEREAWAYILQCFQDADKNGIYHVHVDEYYYKDDGICDCITTLQCVDRVSKELQERMLERLHKKFNPTDRKGGYWWPLTPGVKHKFRIKAIKEMIHDIDTEAEQEGTSAPDSVRGGGDSEERTAPE